MRFAYRCPMCRWIMIVLMVIGGSISGLTYEDSLMCETCHTDKLGQYLKPEAAALTACTVCHEDVSHKDVIGVTEACTDCHDHGVQNKDFLSKTYQNFWLLSRANPHVNDYMCGVCHQTSEIGTVGGVKWADDVQLCDPCHKKEDVNLHAHSAGFKYEPSDQVRIPKEFPLQDGHVTCKTCHEFNCDGKKGHLGGGDAFLRTAPAAREQFCIQCHQPEQYQRHNPHIQFDTEGQLIEGNCLVCHTRQPDLKTDIGKGGVALKGNLNSVCEGCHMLRESHPTGTNHIRPIPLRLRSYVDRKIEDAGVPFPLGEDYQVLCITCHTPHQYELFPEHAKEKSRSRTRYLSGYDLCIMCHIK